MKTSKHWRKCRQKSVGFNSYPERQRPNSSTATPPLLISLSNRESLPASALVNGRASASRSKALRNFFPVATQVPLEPQPIQPGSVCVLCAEPVADGQHACRGCVESILKERAQFTHPIFQPTPRKKNAPKQKN